MRPERARRSRPSGAPPRPLAAGDGGRRTSKATPRRRRCRWRGQPRCGPSSPSTHREDADRWLERRWRAEEADDALVAEGIALLNRALYAHAAASRRPTCASELTPEQSVAVRIGYGSGEEVAGGRFSAAREVDVWATAPRAGGGAKKTCARRSGSRRCSAAASRSTPARRCCCAPAPTSTRGRGARRPCSCGSGWRRCWSSWPQRSAPIPATTRTWPSWRRAAARSARRPTWRFAGTLDAEQERSGRELLEICERVLRRRRVLAAEASPTSA